jgi:hypothetical protein
VISGESIDCFHGSFGITLRSAHHSILQQAIPDLEEKFGVLGIVSQCQRSIALVPIDRCTVTVS